MMVLWEHGEVTSKQLGDKLYLDSGTLTPLLKKMESEGYIIRSRSKEDERVVVISLTEKGAALKEDAAKIPPQMASCVSLPPEDAKKLYDILYKLLDLN